MQQSGEPLQWLNNRGEKLAEHVPAALRKRAAFLGTRGLLLENALSAFRDKNKFLELNQHNNARLAQTRGYALVYLTVQRYGFKWFSNKSGSGYWRTVGKTGQYAPGLLAAFDLILLQENKDI